MKQARDYFILLVLINHTLILQVLTQNCHLIYDFLDQHLATSFWSQQEAAHRFLYLKPSEVNKTQLSAGMLYNTVNFGA